MSLPRPVLREKRATKSEFMSDSDLLMQLVSTNIESGLSVSLHPLPLLSISEHFTRTRLQTGNDNVRVVGALIGTQNGRELEIANSFEFAFTNQADCEVDHGLFTTRRDQFKQVFPTYEVLGWYTCGFEPTREDLDIHKQLLTYNENPLFLQLSPLSIHPVEKELPIQIYEAITEIISNQQQTFFIKVPYRVETGEAERVAVDHAAKPSGQSGSDSAEIAHLTTHREALKMLNERVQLLVEYLTRVEAGLAPKDHETLRQISSLVASLPAAESNEFREEFNTEYADASLTSYLATLTRGLGPINDLVDRFSLYYSAQNQSNMGPTGAPGGRGPKGRRDY